MELGDFDQQYKRIRLLKLSGNSFTLVFTLDCKVAAA